MFTYLSVHYVASGHGHLDRLPCCIRIKHEGEVQSKQVIVNWGNMMINPLTELTHLTVETIEAYGTSFQHAMALVRAELSPDTILVGMNTKRHVHALQLCKNVHYHSYVDLTSQLKIKHGPRWHFLPIQTMASVLGMDPHANFDELDMIRHVHGQCLSVPQFESTIAQLKSHLTSQPKHPCDAQHRFSIDGICTSAYNAQRCSCDQPSLNPHPSNKRRAVKPAVSNVSE
jgi:hypothetical protein